MAINDGRVVSNFIVQALRGEPLTIYGDGQQSRSFCFATDLVEGIYRMLMLEESPLSPINLGNPYEFTMTELALLVIDLVKSESALEYKPLPSDDPRQRKPDISLAKTVLGWEPTIQLREGILETIRYFKLALL